MNNIEYFKMAQDIINAVSGDCEERKKDYVVWYETDLSKDWVKVLNSEWFYVYISEVLDWSMVRGVCKIRSDNYSWELWVIGLREFKENEIEEMVLNGIEID